MKLTERCKEDFYKYLIENYPVNESDVNKWFLSLYVEFQNTLIIDFFDSVGFYINIFFYYRGFEFNIIDEKSGKIYDLDNDEDVFNSRLEAQTEAIKKANEIYNQNK